MESDRSKMKPEGHIALLLSGGGYRATMFHLGVLCSLHELSLLEAVSEVVAVSGGSLLAAHFLKNYEKYIISFPDAAMELVDFVETVDVKRKVLGLGNSPDAANAACAIFQNDLLKSNAAISFSALTKRAEEVRQRVGRRGAPPRVTLLGTAYTSGGCVAFGSEGMHSYADGLVRDWGGLARDNLIADPHSVQFDLAKAVSASSAFPPFFPPQTFDVHPGVAVASRSVVGPVGDGGIRDNLGMSYYQYIRSGDYAGSHVKLLVSNASVPFDWMPTHPLPKMAWLDGPSDVSSQSFSTWFDRLMRVFDTMMARTAALDLKIALSAGLSPTVIPCNGNDCPEDEDLALPPYDRKLTLLPARIAAHTPTDLAPLTRRQVFSLMRLGYDQARRAFGGAEAANADLRKLWSKLTNTGKLFDSHEMLAKGLGDDYKGQVNNLLDALEMMPMSPEVKNSLKVILKWCDGVVPGVR